MLNRARSGGLEVTGHKSDIVPQILEHEFPHVFSSCSSPARPVNDSFEQKIEACRMMSDAELEVFGKNLKREIRGLGSTPEDVRARGKLENLLTYVYGSFRRRHSSALGDDRPTSPGPAPEISPPVTVPQPSPPRSSPPAREATPHQTSPQQQTRSTPWPPSHPPAVSEFVIERQPFLPSRDSPIPQAPARPQRLRRNRARQSTATEEQQAATGPAQAATWGLNPLDMNAGIWAPPQDPQSGQTPISTAAPTRRCSNLLSLYQTSKDQDDEEPKPDPRIAAIPRRYKELVERDEAAAARLKLASHRLYAFAYSTPVGKSMKMVLESQHNTLYREIVAWIAANTTPDEQLPYPAAWALNFKLARQEFDEHVKEIVRKKSDFPTQPPTGCATQ